MLQNAIVAIVLLLAAAYIIYKVRALWQSDSPQCQGCPFAPNCQKKQAGEECEALK